MSKWKGRTEDGFLCENEAPDSQNRLERSEGSLPGPRAARFHSTRGQRAEWMVTMRRVRAEEGGRTGESFVYLLNQ